MDGLPNFDLTLNAEFSGLRPRRGLLAYLGSIWRKVF